MKTDTPKRYRTAMPPKQITLTLGSEREHKALKRCAKKWSEEFMPGGMTQPVSAYVRWLWATSLKSKRGF